MFNLVFALVLVTVCGYLWALGRKEQAILAVVLGGLLLIIITGVSGEVSSVKQNIEHIEHIEHKVTVIKQSITQRQPVLLVAFLFLHWASHRILLKCTRRCVVMSMIPSKQKVEYKTLDDLKWYGMYIAACLSDNQTKDMKEAWERAGGVKANPWWKFVLEHTKVSLDFAPKR